MGITLQQMGCVTELISDRRSRLRASRWASRRRRSRLRDYANIRLVARGTSVPKRALIIAGPRRLNYPRALGFYFPFCFTRKAGQIEGVRTRALERSSAHMGEAELRYRCGHRIQRLISRCHPLIRLIFHDSATCHLRPLGVKARSPGDTWPTTLNVTSRRFVLSFGVSVPRGGLHEITRWYLAARALQPVSARITNAAGALFVAPFFESENALTFRRTFHPIRLLLDGLPYGSLMAPPLRGISRIYARCNRLPNRARSLRFLLAGRGRANRASQVVFRVKDRVSCCNHQFRRCTCGPQARP